MSLVPSGRPIVDDDDLDLDTGAFENTRDRVPDYLGLIEGRNENRHRNALAGRQGRREDRPVPAPQSQAAQRHEPRQAYADGQQEQPVSRPGPSSRVMNTYQLTKAERSSSGKGGMT